jgi:hypothetical protein
MQAGLPHSTLLSIDHQLKGSRILLIEDDKTTQNTTEIILNNLELSTDSPNNAQ